MISIAFFAVFVAQSSVDVHAIVDAGLTSCYARRTVDACKIELPEGTYALKKTLALCPGVSLVGQGGSTPGTTLDVGKAPITAIHALPFSTCKAVGRTWRGATTIEDLRVVSSTKWAETSTLAGVTRGIFVQNPARISRVSTIGFVVGVEISADTNRAESSNANGWRLDDVSISGAHHAGFYAHGGDSNAGLWIYGGASGNCFSGSIWSSVVGSSCAGVVDNSFLGSTFVNVRASTNNAHRPGCYADSTSCFTAYFPGFVFGHPSQRSLCLGCYTEGDQNPSKLSQSSIAIGGKSTWDLRTKGLRLEGSNVNSVVIRDANGAGTLSLGHPSGALISVEGTSGYPLRLKALGSLLYLDIANLSRARPLSLQLVDPYLGKITAKKALFEIVE